MTNKKSSLQLHEEMLAALADIQNLAQDAEVSLKTSTPEPLLRDLRQLETALIVLKKDAVTRARVWGIPWASIGSALGMSRQAAWERYSDLD